MSVSNRADDPQNADWIPRPDPTTLTTAALLREIGAVKEVFDARLKAMDEALQVRKGELTAAQHHTESQFEATKELIAERFRTVEEKFHSVEQQFIERDTRVKESATARDTAVAAALQAQKEAAGEQTKSFTVSINKSEQATSEQIIQLRLYVEQAIRAINDKIDDIKERVDRGEGVGTGHSSAVIDQRASSGDMRSTIALAVSILLAAMAIMTFIIRLH